MLIPKPHFNVLPTFWIIQYIRRSTSSTPNTDSSGFLCKRGQYIFNFMQNHATCCNSAFAMDALSWTSRHFARRFTDQSFSRNRSAFSGRINRTVRERRLFRREKPPEETAYVALDDQPRDRLMISREREKAVTSIHSTILILSRYFR